MASLLEVLSLFSGPYSGPIVLGSPTQDSSKLRLNLPSTDPIIPLVFHTHPLDPFGSFHKKRDQNGPQSTILLVMRAPRKVHLVLRNSHLIRRRSGGASLRKQPLKRLGGRPRHGLLHPSRSRVEGFKV